MDGLNAPKYADGREISRDLLLLCEWNVKTQFRFVIYDDYTKLSVVWATPALLEFWGCDSVQAYRERQAKNYSECSVPLKDHFIATQKFVAVHKNCTEPKIWSLTLRGQSTKSKVTYSPIIIDRGLPTEHALVRAEFGSAVDSYDVPEGVMSDMRAAAAFRFSNSPIFLCDMSGKLIEANFAADAILSDFKISKSGTFLSNLMDAGEAPFDDVIGRINDELSSIDSGNSSSYRYEKVMQLPIESYNRKGNGWWMLLLTPMVGPKDMQRLLLATLVDVTNEKLREEGERQALVNLKLRDEAQVAIQKCFNDLARILETAHAPIFTLDTDGKIVEWNLMAEEVIGVTKRNALGKKIIDLVMMTENHRETVASVLAKSLRGIPTSNFEFIFVSPDQREVHILFSVAPRKDDLGNVLGTVAVGQDITQMLETQKQLSVLEKRRVAEASRATAERDLSEFLFHEIRNPLAALDIAMRTLRQQLGEESKYNEELDCSMQCVTYMKRILSNVLDLAKIRAGTLSVEQMDVTTMQLFENSTSMLKRSVNPGVELKLQVDPGAEKFRGDFNRMTHVLVNLVTNSIKFTANGEILVRASLESGSIVISVCDTGIGVPKDTRDVLFQKPYATPSVNGSGLGLILISQIVFIAGGYLRVASKTGPTDVFSYDVHSPGMDGVLSYVNHNKTIPTYLSNLESGTCIELVLPHHMKSTTEAPEMVCQKPQPTVQRTKAEIHMNWSPTGRILVLDDQALVRKMFINFLKRNVLPEDWKIDEAEDYDDAKPLLETHAYMMIVCDQHMSNTCKGSKVIPFMRKSHEHSVIIGTSGNDCADEMLNSGADLFWRKPWGKSEKMLQDIDEQFSRKHTFDVSVK